MCPFPSFSAEEARATRRNLNRHWRFPVSVFQCEKCDHYHLRANTDRMKIPKIALKVLRGMALGYSLNEISADAGINYWTADEYRKKMREAFGANSSAHLVAIAISFGLLDTREFVSPLTERCDSV